MPFDRNKKLNSVTINNIKGIPQEIWTFFGLFRKIFCYARLQFSSLTWWDGKFFNSFKFIHNNQCVFLLTKSKTCYHPNGQYWPHTSLYLLYGSGTRRSTHCSRTLGAFSHQPYLLFHILRENRKASCMAVTKVCFSPYFT